MLVCNTVFQQHFIKKAQYILGLKKYASFQKILEFYIKPKIFSVRVV